MSGGGRRDIEPGQEYTADTHPLAVAAGQVTNLSPERGDQGLGIHDAAE